MGFRYGLNLDPFMYYTAVKDLKLQREALAGSNYERQVSQADFTAPQKLAKLIHLRQDVGFPGITEFHCRAILGACWDNNAATYPGHTVFLNVMRKLKLNWPKTVLLNW